MPDSSYGLKNIIAKYPPQLEAALDAAEPFFQGLSEVFGPASVGEFVEMVEKNLPGTQAEKQSVLVAMLYVTNEDAFRSTTDFDNIHGAATGQLVRDILAYRDIGGVVQKPEVARVLTALTIPSIVFMTEFVKSTPDGIMLPGDADRQVQELRSTLLPNLDAPGLEAQLDKVSNNFLALFSPPSTRPRPPRGPVF